MQIMSKHVQMYTAILKYNNNNNNDSDSDNDSDNDKYIYIVWNIKTINF